MKSPTKYKIEISWSEEDQAYLARVPELEGCATHGETVVEAAENAHAAIDLYLASLEARGLPIPPPLAERNFSGNIPLRLEPIHHRDLALVAEARGASLNQYITDFLQSARRAQPATKKKERGRLPVLGEFARKGSARPTEEQLAESRQKRLEMKKLFQSRSAKARPARAKVKER